MRVTNYAADRLNMLKGEMGTIQRVFHSQGSLSIEFENGMCLQLHDDEIENQTMEVLEDALRQVKHG